MFFKVQRACLTPQSTSDMTQIGGSGCIPQSWISLSIRQLGQVCSLEHLRPKRKKGVDLINSLLVASPESLECPTSSANSSSDLGQTPQSWAGPSMITPIQAVRLLQLAAHIDNGFPLWSLNSTLE